MFDTSDSLEAASAVFVASASSVHGISASWNVASAVSDASSSLV